MLPSTGLGREWSTSVVPQILCGIVFKTNNWYMFNWNVHDIDYCSWFFGSELMCLFFALMQIFIIYLAGAMSVALQGKWSKYRLILGAFLCTDVADACQILTPVFYLSANHIMCYSSLSVDNTVDDVSTQPLVNACKVSRGMQPLSYSTLHQEISNVHGVMGLPVCK